MVITLDTEYGQLDIELLDNPFTQKWYEHFLMIKEKYTATGYLLARPSAFDPYEYGRKRATDFFEKNLTELSDVVSKIQDLNVGYPVEFDADVIRERTMKSQYLLNNLHRTFTNLQRSRILSAPLSFSEDGSRPIVADDETKNKLIAIIPRINDLVHVLEKYIPTKFKNLKDPNTYRYLAVNPNYYNANSTTTYWSGAYKEIQDNDTLRYSSDDPKYDVWLGMDILGKDYITAFYDHEDPRKWDVSPAVGYTGKFEIDLEESRTGIMRSWEFKGWLQNYNVEYHPVMCGIPLGKVIAGKENFKAQIPKQTTPAIVVKTSYK